MAATRVDFNIARPATVAAAIGRSVTVDLYDGKRTGRIERVENGRPIVRFADGTWAYGRTRCTVR